MKLLRNPFQIRNDGECGPAKLRSSITGRTLRLPGRYRKCLLGSLAQVNVDVEQTVVAVLSRLYARLPWLPGQLVPPQQQRRQCDQDDDDDNSNPAERQTSSLPTEDAEKLLIVDQSARIGQFLRQAFDSLKRERVDEIARACAGLGVALAQLPVSFDAQLWLTLKRTVIEQVVDDGQTSCAAVKTIRVQAWNAFLSFLIHETKDSFYKETRRRLSACLCPDDVQVQVAENL